jgi:hypothetical protein
MNNSRLSSSLPLGKALGGGDKSGFAGMFNDEAIPTLATDVCPDPLQKDTEPQAVFRQKL